MKSFFKCFITFSLSLTLLSGFAFAQDTKAQEDAAEKTKFDAVMELVEYYSLDAEGRDILREYFNQYFEKHPDQFVSIVNDIMQSIDSHSMYMSADEYAATFGQTLSTYIGIGVRLSPSGGVIDEVYENGPAYEAGLHIGDIIRHVDNEDVTQASGTDILKLLGGNEGDTVNLTVERGDETLTFQIKRRNIVPEHVTNRTLAQGIEYIRVSAMGSEEDTQKFLRVWKGLPSRGVHAVILDLRGNGGGLISMAQAMIEAIIPEKGIQYLTLRYREDEGGIQKFYTPGGGFAPDKLVLLVNGGTASAAEIVSGSLSDLGYATLLGEPTYGKGVGQYHMELGDGSKLIVTSLEIQLPKRGTYEGVGLTPEMEVKSGTQDLESEVLQPLDTTKLLFPGDRGKEVIALTQRLSLLGYLDGPREGFDASVLDAVRRFQLSCGLFPGVAAAPDTLLLLESQTRAQSSNAGALDRQLAAALNLCKLAEAS